MSWMAHSKKTLRKESQLFFPSRPCRLLDRIVFGKHIRKAFQISFSRLTNIIVPIRKSSWITVLTCDVDEPHSRSLAQKIPLQQLHTKTDVVFAGLSGVIRVHQSETLRPSIRPLEVIE